MMAKRVPIKPGCLCLVLPGVSEIPAVVRAGDIVTAVEYRGSVMSMGGKLVNYVWKITNARIEHDLRNSPGDWIGCSEAYLQPISDPDQDITILLEQAEELMKEVTGILNK